MNYLSLQCLLSLTMFPSLHTFHVRLLSFVKDQQQAQLFSPEHIKEVMFNVNWILEVVLLLSS